MSHALSAHALGNWYIIRRKQLQEMYLAKQKKDQEDLINNFCVKLRSDVLHVANQGQYALMANIPENIYNLLPRVEEILKYTFPDSDVIVNTEQKTIIISWE
jgi:hypothetical protein